ncbi:MAG: hypothetical protein WED87_05525, partial [Dehalococcoidia bacterium]
MEREGMVFHAEWEFPPDGDQLSRMKAWHWPERELVRTELHDQDAHRSTTIYAPEREVSHQLDDGRVDDRRVPGGQWDPERGGGAAFFPHIAYWGAAQERDVLGPAAVDGREVVHVRAVYTVEEARHEQPKGATYTSDIYLDPQSLLPVSVTLQVVFPGSDDADNRPATIRFLGTEFLEPGELPERFFNQDELAAEEVTMDEAIDLAANQPFEAYWLGREIDVAWDAPDGSRHSSTALSWVKAPGMVDGSVDRVVAAYGGPDGYSPSLITVISSMDPSFTGLRPNDLEALERTGSITALTDGSGFRYARYIARGSCTLEQAQRDPACRMFAEPTYGVLVQRGETRVHLMVEALLSGDSRGAKHVNPFNDPDLLERLAGELRPFGQ